MKTKYITVSGKFEPFKEPFPAWSVYYTNPGDSDVIRNQIRICVKSKYISGSDRYGSFYEPGQDPYERQAFTQIPQNRVELLLETNSGNVWNRSIYPNPEYTVFRNRVPTRIKSMDTTETEGSVVFGTESVCCQTYMSESGRHTFFLYKIDLIRTRFFSKKNLVRKKLLFGLKSVRDQSLYLYPEDVFRNKIPTRVE